MRRTSPPLSPPSPVADLRPSMASATTTQLFLFVTRRMALCGIDDAMAASALMARFGAAYRRPLVLMRALLLELSRASQRKISLSAPCCVRRTDDENAMLRALTHGEGDSRACHAQTCRLLGLTSAIGATTCFQAVGQCFADLGAPFRPD